MRWLALALLAVGIAACGSAPPDLFEVIRSGPDRNANVTMVVNDGGQVSCNRKQHELDAKDLLRARALLRALEPQAELNLSLPRGPRSELSYRVRMEAGEVRVSDTSPCNPASFFRLAALTKDVTERICGLERSRGRRSAARASRRPGDAPQRRGGVRVAV